VSQQESNAKQIFIEKLIAQPKEVIARVLVNFFKYLFVPVEVSIFKVTTLYKDEQTYSVYVRPILAMACLPIWFLSLTPPFGARKEVKMYYLLGMMLVLYVIGISAITNFAGERMRFPVLATMLPVLASNVHNVSRYVNRRLRSFGRGKSTERRPKQHSSVPSHDI